MLQLGCSSTGTFDHRPLRMGDVTLVSGCRIHITLAGPLASQIQLANRGWLSSAKSGHLLDRTGGQVQAELGQSYAETDVLHPP